MAELHGDLMTVLEATFVSSPEHYRIAGVAYRRAIAPHRPPSDLIVNLARDLYFQLYCRPVATDSTVQPSAVFLATLSEANTGLGTWEQGWTLGSKRRDGSCIVWKDGVAFWVSAADVRIENDGDPRSVCAVWAPKEYRALVPGFYMALGDASLPNSARLLRFYWNLEQEAGGRFIGETTRRFNTAGIPFRAKVPNRPNGYGRADAGVVYLDRRDAERAWPVLLELAKALEPMLRDETPMFTRKMAKGVALADDPANGLSFGQHRCELAARAIWSSYLLRDDASTRTRRMVDSFRNAGFDPNRPYLASSSAEDYPELRSISSGAGFEFKSLPMAQ